MYTIVRRFEWDSLHRIPQHEGQCRCFHGHRYAAEIYCAATKLDKAGRVIDFSVVKETLGAWIDEALDHTAILQRTDDHPGSIAIADANKALGKPAYLIDDPPTAEAIAKVVFLKAHSLLSAHDITVRRVRVWETPNCSAIWEPTDDNRPS
jgi:6-pyruvoyltetrahydropterin/6-carboxytetrahydropterin synthase